MAPQLTQTERERIVQLRLGGCRVSDICRQTGITKKTIIFWFKRWQNSGNVVANHRQNYPRSTTAADDAAIIAAHSADPFLSTRVTSTSYNISMDTVRRRLKDARKKGCRPDQSRDSSHIENKIKVFCPKCNMQVSHTAEGIQKDQTKTVIAKVHHFFEQEYKELEKINANLDLTPLPRFRHRTALATGVSETTVLQILQEEEEREKASKRKRPCKRPIPNHKLSEDDSDDANKQGNTVQKAENKVETILVKVEPPDYDNYPEIFLGAVDVKKEPRDDELSEMKALTDQIAGIVKTEPFENTADNPNKTPATKKRKERKKKQRTSDVKSTQQHSQNESSNMKTWYSIPLKEE